MLKHLKKLKQVLKKRQLNPSKPEERRELVRQAVERTVREYGEALRRLGAE